MKNMETSLLRVAFFIIGIIVLVLCITWLPYMANSVVAVHPEVDYLRFPILFGIYLTVLPFYFALYQSLNLLKFIDRGTAFSERSVSSLKYIRNCAVLISVLYVLGIIILDSQNAANPGIILIGLVIIFASVIISVFSGLLQQVLRHAIMMKSDIDLTI